MERVVVLGSTELICAEDLPDAILKETAAACEPVNALAEGIRQANSADRAAIEQANGNYQISP